VDGTLDLKAPASQEPREHVVVKFIGLGLAGDQAREVQGDDAVGRSRDGVHFDVAVEPSMIGKLSRVNTNSVGWAVFSGETTAADGDPAVCSGETEGLSSTFVRPPSPQAQSIKTKQKAKMTASVFLMVYTPQKSNFHAIIV
jgi:hypothetical protein